MRSLIFSAKRTVCRPMFLLLLAVYILSIILAGEVGAKAELPPAGVYDASGTESSERIVAYLTENGFVQYEDIEEMKARVSTGDLDCAAILPQDLTRRLEEDDLDGCVTWIVSPISFIPDLYKDHVAAAIFHEHTPHMTRGICGR